MEPAGDFPFQTAAVVPPSSLSQSQSVSTCSTISTSGYCHLTTALHISRRRLVKMYAAKTRLATPCTGSLTCHAIVEVEGRGSGVLSGRSCFGKKMTMNFVGGRHMYDHLGHHPGKQLTRHWCTECQVGRHSLILQVLISHFLSRLWSVPGSSLQLRRNCTLSPSPCRTPRTRSSDTPRSGRSSCCTARTSSPGPGCSTSSLAATSGCTAMKMCSTGSCLASSCPASDGVQSGSLSSPSPRTLSAVCWGQTGRCRRLPPLQWPDPSSYGLGRVSSPSWLRDHLLHLSYGLVSSHLLIFFIFICHSL